MLVLPTYSKVWITGFLQVFEKLDQKLNYGELGEAVKPGVSKPFLYIEVGQQYFLFLFF